jgi:hypothetical protein
VAKCERFIVVGDNHGNMQDDKAVAALFEFMRFWKPKHRIHLGDNWDFRWLRGKASEDDKLDPGLQADFDMGAAFVDKFRPTVFLAGNHDWRVRKSMESPNPVKSKLAGMIWGDMEDSLKGTKIHPYNKREGVYKFGDLKMVHGYAAGVGAVRKHALVYQRVYLGHLHMVEHVSVETHNRGEAWCVGGLAKLEMGYNEAQIGTLRQSHGCRYGIISASGRTMAWQAEASRGRWNFPSEMKEMVRA